jgi:hypothetical protein
MNDLVLAPAAAGPVRPGGRALLARASVVGAKTPRAYGRRARANERIAASLLSLRYLVRTRPHILQPIAARLNIRIAWPPHLIHHAK